MYCRILGFEVGMMQDGRAGFFFEMELAAATFPSIINIILKCIGGISFFSGRRSFTSLLS
jgi:hypothetical protein